MLFLCGVTRCHLPTAGWLDSPAIFQRALHCPDRRRQALCRFTAPRVDNPGRLPQPRICIPAARFIATAAPRVDNDRRMSTGNEQCRDPQETLSLGAGGSGSLSAHTISKLLIEHQQGIPDARDALIQVIYDELRQIAGRVLKEEITRDQSLGITGLVHEAYLKIESYGLFDRALNSRQLFGAVHRAMRQVLTDRARDRHAAPQGTVRRLPLDDHLEKVERLSDCSMAELHASLEKLASLRAQAAEIIDMRLFGELNNQSISELLEVPVSTVETEFRFGRALLYQELKGE
jgi:RNA polymerase sigma factor (TIGR02999 family)